MLLAQNTVNPATIGVVEKTPQQIATATAGLGTSLFIIFLMPILGIVSFILWVVALAQVISRHDIKNGKTLWILLLIFLAPVGMLSYFFTEDRKKLGWISLIIFIAMILLPVISFITR